ncbi:MAG: translation initiation factor IF-3 [Chloroflexi bacterium 13_1_20CM_2_70_9]|nr:MAG: translation initiation factor IF-3 [Chloroflexi bacterium 13_1_20CM_2_70_9]
MPTARALAKAQEEGYDLVEIAPTSQPPVCRILDFGKYRYELQQKTKDAKKKQRAVTWKEIRVSPKINEHDIDTKIRSAAKFLDEGDKLKVTVRFRGRELAHPDRGRVLLLAIGDKLKEHGTIERQPLLEGRSMGMIMNPLRRDAAPAPVGPAGAQPAPAATAAARPAATAPRPAPTAAPASRLAASAQPVLRGTASLRSAGAPAPALHTPPPPGPAPVARPAPPATPSAPPVARPSPSPRARRPA